jgi:transcriptional regulator with XRE-family HTH domain
VLDFSQIGKALRRLRQRQNLRQADLAEAAEITAPMLSAYETGRQRPSFATIDKVLAALECDAADLVAALQAVDHHENLTEPERRREEAGVARINLPQSFPRNAPFVSADYVLTGLDRLTEAEQAHLSSLLPELLGVLRKLKL